MDTRYFGSNLMALNEIAVDRRCLSTAKEDAYYAQHRPARGRIERIASVCAVLCFGFVTIGLWLQS